MATQFQLTRDINGYNGFGLAFTDTNYSAALAANTDTTVTIPSSSSIGAAGFLVLGPNGEALPNPQPQLIAILQYSPGAVVWVSLNAAANVPVGSTFAATTSELNPAARVVKGGDVLHFYTSDVGDVVGISLYWLNKQC